MARPNLYKIPSSTRLDEIALLVIGRRCRVIATYKHDVFFKYGTIINYTPDNGFYVVLDYDNNRTRQMTGSEIEIYE